jgi:hypothetical protein
MLRNQDGCRNATECDRDVPVASRAGLNSVN